MDFDAINNLNNIMEDALGEDISCVNVQPKNEPIYLCKCLLNADSSDRVEISARKQKILGTVTRTENYLRERRIPELIRYLLTKALAHAPTTPMIFLEKLLDDCMMFRAGHGCAPVLYENRHLEAVIRSFDPGNRGWLSPSQTRQAFLSLGLTPPNDIEERIDCEAVLNNLRRSQEQELFSLLTAGMTTKTNTKDSNSSSSI